MKVDKIFTSLSVLGFSLIAGPLWADDAVVTASGEAAAQTKTEASATSQSDLTSSVQSKTDAAVNLATSATTSAATTADAAAKTQTETSASGSASSGVAVNLGGSTSVSGSVGGSASASGAATANGSTQSDVKSDLKSDLTGFLGITIGGNKPERPERPTLGAELSAEVKAMIEKISVEKQALLNVQADLLLQARGSAAAQRDQIRESIKEQREAWLQTRQMLALETKLRLAELRAEFKNKIEMETIVNAAKDDAKSRRGQN